MWKIGYRRKRITGTDFSSGTVGTELTETKEY